MPKYEVSKKSLELLKEGKTDYVQCLKTGERLSREDCEKEGLFKPKAKEPRFSATHSDEK